MANTGRLLRYAWAGPNTLLGLALGVVGVLFVAMIIGHIYIGTLGMEGAFEAMGEGTVDQNWAKEHHPLWYREEVTRAPAGKPVVTPAE